MVKWDRITNKHSWFKTEKNLFLCLPFSLNSWQRIDKISIINFLLSDKSANKHANQQHMSTNNSQGNVKTITVKSGVQIKRCKKIFICGIICYGQIT